MATSKPAIVKSEERPAPVRPEPRRKEPGSAMNFFDKVTGTWQNFSHFLSDVRAETRKVVTPSRKEVQATTTVVIVAVFIFGLYFFLVDWIFGRGLHALLARLGGVRP
jgi:preprotein translocase subunit SecE